jgi:hypothetical protein
MNELTEALHDLVRDPVVPPSLASRVATAHARRRRRRAIGASAVAVAAVAGLATVVPSLARRPAPVAPASPVPRMLGATGVVVARPGQPVRFCDTEPRADVAGRPPEPPACAHMAVNVDGVDLGRLAYRQESGGTVWGSAWLEGEYADSMLTVLRQEAPRALHDPVNLPVPCPAPSGGWPEAPPVVSEPLAVVAYSDAHPGLVVGKRIGYAGGRRVQIVSAVDPERVEAELGPQYNGALCVVRSRYTAEQIDAAVADARDFLGVAYRYEADIDEHAQMYADVPVVADEDPGAQELVARHPAGLVRLDPWLKPV